MKKLIILFLLLLASGLTAETELNLSFIGDILAHDVNFRIRNYAPVYENVKDIFLADDLTFANLEFPVDETKAYSTYPLFNVHRDYVQAVIDAGMDVFSLANNHSYDKGLSGVFQTLISMISLKEKAQRDIYYSGIRGNLEQEFKPVTIYKKGFKIGFIAVTGFLNIYPDKPYIYLVRHYNKKEANAFLEFVKRESPKYDLFVVSFHTGVEYVYEPNPRKERFYKKIIAAGAHILYGHHPHVLQPVEMLEVDGQKRLIIYSAGNFISGQRWGYSTPYPLEHFRSYTGDSAIYQVKVTKTEKGVEISQPEMEFVGNHITKNRQVIVMKYQDLLELPLNKTWKNYYRARYKLMQKFLP